MTVALIILLLIFDNQFFLWRQPGAGHTKLRPCIFLITLENGALLMLISTKKQRKLHTIKCNCLLLPLSHISCIYSLYFAI